MITQEQFIEEVRKHLDKKYKACASGPHAFDCVSLIGYSAHELGIFPEDMWQEIKTSKVHVAKNARLYKQMTKQFNQIDRENIQPGDILLFKQKNLQFPTHVAIYSDPDKMIQANNRFRKVVETHIDPSVWDNIIGIYRLPAFGGIE